MAGSCPVHPVARRRAAMPCFPPCLERLGWLSIATKHGPSDHFLRDEDFTCARHAIVAVNMQQRTSVGAERGGLLLAINFFTGAVKEVVEATTAL